MAITKHKHKFGLPAGRHANKRKHANKGRPTYSYKKIPISTHKMRILIKKRKIRHHVQSTKSSFASGYSMHRANGQLKFIFSKRQAMVNTGYRIINIQQLNNYISDLALHVGTCVKAITLCAKGVSPISFLHEHKSYGLASVLEISCKGCGASKKLETSPRIAVNGHNRYDINVRGVWGSMATGNGSSHLNEMLGTMNAPGLRKQTFSKIEQEISDWWGKALHDEMLATGAEERKIAIEKGNFHQGVPAVTVICDGGWSKRTHKHSYNASGGVAVIIGQQTGKLLHVGIRNKYCYICEHASACKQDPKEHRCFRNWSSSSQAMESDIIVEGFQIAEQVHGIRYMKIIADGDSSVYANIQEHVPVWGKDVMKLECANHICKCLRSSLERLVSDNPNYKGKNKLTQAVRIHIVSAVRCAIRLRSKMNDKQSASKLMAHDIKNCVYHIFGQHENCSDFCTAATHIPVHDKSGSTLQQVPTISNTDDSDGIDELLNSQAMFWTEGLSEDAQQESRKRTCTNQLNADLDKNLLCDVSLLLQRVANKSDRLLENVTTNIAESWMHIRSKFDGGKVLNLCNRGSWHARCYGAAVRQNFGPKWAPAVWAQSTDTAPGFYFAKLYDQRNVSFCQRKIISSSAEAKRRRWKKKMKKATKPNAKSAAKAYGPDATDVVADVDSAELELAKQKYLEKHIQLPEDRLSVLYRQTLTQSESQVWRTERKKRITASNFAAVVKRNPKLKVRPLVENLLYSNFRGNTYTARGLQEERTSVQEYILKKAEEGVNAQVEQMGMIIDKKNKFLSASPDGKVINSDNTVGLLEIKNVLLNKPITLIEAASAHKSFCLQIIDQRLQLKKIHKFHHQIQGQLNIADLPWCDFVVRTTNPYQLHIERINKDTDLWDEMVPKLSAFYHKAILPELAIPRHGKYPGIREPGTWYSVNQPVQPTCRKRCVDDKECTSSRSRSAGPSTVNIPKLTQPSTDQRLTSRSPSAGPSTAKIPKLTQPSTDQRLTSSTPRASTSQLASNTKTVTTTTAETVPAEQSVCRRRSSRSSATSQKFVGRRISHQWIVDQPANATEWFNGVVLDVVRGRDGEATACYEVLYDGEETPHEVDHLVEDFRKSSVKFLDL